MKRLPYFTSSPYKHTGGLVHRTGTSNASSSEASGWGPPGAEKDLDVPDPEEGYDDKGEDSKTVRMTLMEEVLLLGIKDREVSGQVCYSYVIGCKWCRLCSWFG